MGSHPFTEGTRLAHIFAILSDGEWHCGKHELPGTQPAKAIQVIRHNGFDVANNMMHCSECGYSTMHRRLISSTPSNPSKVRLRISSQMRRRVLRHYQSKEAITQREMESDQLEVDHRFPQVRWSKDEPDDSEMSEEELQHKFQLLTRGHNLWKSRYCEHCKKTGQRGTFIGIIFYAEGGPQWPIEIPDDDERGCFGCFWYNPDAWRIALNKMITIAQS